MIELLEAGARDGADPAVITNSRAAGYAELVAEARAIAAGLSERGITRFGIAHQDAALVTTILAAASLVGAEACVYPPLESESDAADIAAAFDHDVLVSDERPAGSFELLDPAELLAGDAAGAPASPPAARPLLVLSTGTTGVMRAARHDWSRLLRQQRHLQRDPGHRWLFAYGLQQIGGLQMLIHVFGSGATLVAPQPRRPRQGLAAMREHGVDCASATPTFWRFLLAEMRADGGPVPQLRQVTLGGEAVQAGLLEDLAEAFPAARISQIYGANEFGGGSSVRDRRNGLPVEVLQRGEDADVAFRIEDGELWVRSRVGMLGYYGEPEIDPDAWRPTGDLVEVVGDRVEFRGRSSEIINVGGVKVHPLPIEERVGAVPGVELAHVFGRPNRLTGSLVAVEVVPAGDADPETLEEAIREACADLPPAARPRSIRFVETIATAGNKIARGARRD